MADWISFLVQVGGTIAALVLAVGVMGRWLWRKLDTALNAYTSKYLEQKAAIDARIANLEKLVEEQARLTRTVESIKDEIAAQAKRRDNRWAFRKDVYVNLITATSGLIRSASGVALYAKIAAELKETQTPATDVRFKSMIEQFGSSVDEHKLHGDVFANNVGLAPLAVAEDVLPLVAATWEKFKTIDLSSPDLLAANMPEKLQAFSELQKKLQAAGRIDLWGTPESEATPEATT